MKKRHNTSDLLILNQLQDVRRLYKSKSTEYWLANALIDMLLNKSIPEITALDSIVNALFTYNEKLKSDNQGARKCLIT